MTATIETCKALAGISSLYHIDKGVDNEQRPNHCGHGG